MLIIKVTHLDKCGRFIHLKGQMSLGNIFSPLRNILKEHFADVHVFLLKTRLRMNPTHLLQGGAICPVQQVVLVPHKSLVKKPLQEHPSLGDWQ